MDLSHLTDEQLRALAADGSLPGDGSAGPMTITVGAFKPVSEMSDHELNAAASPQPDDRSVVDRIGHAAGVGARAVGQGAVSGVLGMPGLIADSVLGVGRDTAYGAKFLAHALLGTEAPDPTNYGLPAGGRFAEDDRSAFPISGKMADAGAAIPDAIGLPKPENTGERIASAGIEGVTGALTGAGLGNTLLKFGPSAVKGIGTFLAAEPTSQAVAGATGGVGAQTATEAGANAPGSMAAGVAASMLPLAKHAIAGNMRRITSGSEEGQRRIAGTVLRDMAEDPQAAAAALDRAGETRIPGFRHFTSAASRDLGIATNAQKTRDWANLYEPGSVARIEQGNNEILSRAFDRLGATEGSPQATRAIANAEAGAAKADMALHTLPAIPVTDLLDKLKAETNLRRQGTTTEKAAAAQQMHDRITASSKPVQNADGEIIGWRINPERLHMIREEFSSAGRINAADNALGAVKHARAFSKDINTDIAGRLNEVTAGTYGDYLKRQANVRGTADAQEFMQDIVNSSSKRGGEARTLTGARQIEAGSFLAKMSASKADKPLPSGNRTMSIDKLKKMDPIRASFLEGVQGDLNDANLVNQSGMGSRGSSTSRNKEISQLIEDQIKANRSLSGKAWSRVQPFLSAGSAALGKLSGSPVLQGSARIGANVGEEMARAKVSRAEAAVQRHLGRAEVDPAYAAELLRSQGIRNATAREMAGRTALRAGQYGVQGFLAGQRSSRYR